MALDEDFAKLLLMVQALNKRTCIDMALNEALDSFQGVLNEQQDYLRNGIVNVDFPEAALFIEYAAFVFGKEVDILWQNSLEFHMHLCAQNDNAENVAEKNRIIERINQRKRKKITLQNTDISRHLNQDLTTLLNQVSQLLKKSESLQNANDLNKTWKEANLQNKNKSSQNSARTNRDVKIRPTSVFRLPVNEKVNEINSNDQLSNYDDLFSTSALSYLDEMEVDSVHGCCSNDDLLQKYLNAKRLTYERYCWDKCGSDFEQFKKAHQLGEEIVSQQVEGLCPTEYNNNSVVTNAQKSSKAASVCVSDVDSLFHEVEYSEDGFQNSTRISHTRRSMTDSGIYCDGNISDGTHIEEDLQDNGSVIQSLTLQECTTPSVEMSCGNYIDRVAQEAIEYVAQEAGISSEGDLVASLVDNVEAQQLTRKRKRKFDEDIWDEGEEFQEVQRKRKKAKFKLKPLCTVDLHQFETFFEHTYRVLFDEDYTGEASEGVANDDVFDESLENITLGHHSTPVHQSRDSFCSALQDSGIELSSFDESDVVPSDFLPGSVSAPILNSIIREPIVSVTTQTPSKQPDSRLVINEWSKFIQPKLTEAENCLNFDIHEYGTKIMDSVAENKTMQFKNIVKGQKASEVARYFLATLQLANTNNVDIIQPETFGLANNSLQIKLLTRERYHEQLNSYTAPSENDVREKLARLNASRVNVLRVDALRVDAPMVDASSPDVSRPSTSSGSGRSRASNYHVRRRIFN